MMRWSFWLFVLAEFCRRCETEGTWRGVCSRVHSGVQGQSSWGGSRGAPWSCRLFSLGVKLVSLAFWKCYKMCHYKRIRMYITGGGYPNIFSSVLCKSCEWPRRTVGGWTPPQTPRGLATARRDTWDHSLVLLIYLVDEHSALPTPIAWKYLISNFPPSAAELFRLPPHGSGSELTTRHSCFGINTAVVVTMTVTFIGKC